MRTFELHIPVNTQLNAAQLIQTQCDLTTSEIKLAAKNGAIWISKQDNTQNRHLRRVKNKLKSGDILHVYYNESIITQEPPTPSLIHDFDDYSVWYKPYAMLSQGSKYSDHCTINRWVELNDSKQRPAMIVHRLDRAATGLILIAHSKSAARNLSQLFVEHQLEKRYQIIVHGDFRNFKGPDIIQTKIDGKSASSTFQFNQFNAKLNQSLIDVIIQSGRKHQIRIHANTLGFPVVGDRLHNDLNITYSDDSNLQLCAVSLKFNCPITHEKRNIQLDSEKCPNFAQ